MNPDKRASAKKEMRRMNRLIARTKVKVNKILVADYKRKLYHLNRADDMRILTLRTWSMKYKVSLRYILSVLLPYYHKFLKRFQTKGGLGVKLPTLVGKRSEQLLREALAKDFPNDENWVIWKKAKEEEIIKKRIAAQSGEDEFDEYIVRYKNVLDYNSVDEYAKKYMQRISKDRKEYAKIANDPDNQRRAYRESPFL